MDKSKIERINALSRKQRSPEGLTSDEAQEQAQLRAEYIAEFRKSLQSQLDSIVIQEKDGSLHKLPKKNGKNSTPA